MKNTHILFILGFAVGVIQVLTQTEWFILYNIQICLFAYGIGDIYMEKGYSRNWGILTAFFGLLAGIPLFFLKQKDTPHD